MSSVPPSKVEQDSAGRSSPNQQGPRSKIVEILANTANGCISELGYPALSQALKDLEIRNNQWQMENIKLFEDNRTLAHMLQDKKTRVNELEYLARHLTQERDHFKDLWEGKPLGPVVPASEYQRLRAAFEQMDAKYKFWKEQFLRLQNHAQAMGALSSPIPSLTSGMATPTSAYAGSSQSSPYPPHPIYPTPYSQSIPHGHHPTQVQGQPRHTPPHQVQSRPAQPTYVVNRSSPGGHVQMPTQYAHSPTIHHQRKSSDSRPSPFSVVPPNSDSRQNGQIARAREAGTNSVVQTSGQITAFLAKRELQSPSIAHPAQNSPAGIIPPKSEHRPATASSMGIPIQAGSQPLSPSASVPHGMENSVFVRKQDATSQQLPFELPPTPLMHSPESQIPPPQNSLLLAPGAPLVMQGSSTNITPTPELTKSVSPQSSGQSDASEVTTPDVIDHDSTRAVSSPAITMDSAKRVREESPDDTIPGVPNKKPRVEDQASDVAMLLDEPELQGVEEDEDEDEEDTPIEVGPDGLRTENSCLSMLFTADDNNPELKTCGLCQGRYEIGAVQEPPRAFEGASDNELVQHCMNEHLEAWNALRSDVG